MENDKYQDFTTLSEPEKIKVAARWIGEADGVLLGASNGLSIAEGYHLFATNEMFLRQFADFRQKFGIRSVIEGCFYDYPTEADRTAFYCRLIKYWVTDYRPSAMMKNLLTLVGGKPYFVVTSNGDTHLELSGFDPERVFEIEGTFRNAFGEINDKTALLQQFIDLYKDKKLLIMELGIGRRNTLIKQPLMQLAARLPQSRYLTLNLAEELYIPTAIAPRSLGLSGDIAQTLQRLTDATPH